MLNRNREAVEMDAAAVYPESPGGTHFSTFRTVADKKYAIKTDSCQEHRAKELKILSISRPHMSSLHLSWACFFTAFFAWFSCSPLLPVIAQSLGLTQSQIWFSNICCVIGNIILRLITGPLCDRFGSRLVMSSVLLIFSIPVLIGGFVIKDYSSLAVARFFIGGTGAAFIPSQHWMLNMFASNVVGSAQAITAGWGNLGGAVAQVTMVKLYEFIKGKKLSARYEAWQISFVVPGIMLIVMGTFCLIVGEDHPLGSYHKAHGHQRLQRVKLLHAFKVAISCVDTWILALHYGVCFGMELMLFNLATSYFYSHFDMPLSKAATIASIGGAMNVWARPLGGKISDVCGSLHHINKDHPLKGRILWQWVIVAIEGCLLLVFSQASTLYSSVISFVMLEISMFLACGSTFGLVSCVPVEKFAKGAVIGIVGAGGHVGAVLIGLGFMYDAQHDRKVLFILGLEVIVVSFSILTAPFKATRYPHNSVASQNS